MSASIIILCHSGIPLKPSGSSTSSIFPFNLFFISSFISSKPSFASSSYLSIKGYLI